MRADDRGGRTPRPASSSGEWLAFERCATLLECAQQENARGEGGRALEQFLAALYPMVHRFVGYQLPAPAADDVTQEVMIRIARAYDRIDPCDCGPFVVATARHEIARERATTARLKRRARLDRQVSAWRELETARTALDLLEEDELLSALRAACLRLPSRRLRAVALAVLLEGLDPMTVARRLGLASDAVRTRLRRARQLLRRDSTLVDQRLAAATRRPPPPKL